MSDTSNDPLHGITLKHILTKLHEHFGWDELGKRIKIGCFTSKPSMPSSLKLIRRTPWAREKVERLYLKTFHKSVNPWKKKYVSKKV